MEDKKLVLKCVKVGILGGLFFSGSPNRVIHLIDGVEYPIVNGDSLFSVIYGCNDFNYCL